jgi:hypothetical protein
MRLISIFEHQPAFSIHLLFRHNPDVRSNYLLCSHNPDVRSNYLLCSHNPDVRSIYLLCSHNPDVRSNYLLCRQNPDVRSNYRTSYTTTIRMSVQITVPAMPPQSGCELNLSLMTLIMSRVRGNLFTGAASSVYQEKYSLLTSSIRKENQCCEADAAATFSSSPRRNLYKNGSERDVQHRPVFKKKGTH